MALELNVDTLDGLDDSVKGLYVERDGKFQLDVNGIEDVSGLKSALEHERTSRKKAIENASVAEKARLKAIEDQAKESGDHKQLYTSSEEARAALQTELDGVKKGIANSERKTAATKVAAEIAEGANVDLLSKFIVDRLGHADGEVKVLSKTGELTVSSLSDLANEFKNDERFSSLVKGNQSNGGGANGGDKSGGAAKTMTRADFNALNPIAQSNFVKEKGIVTD